MSRPDATTEEAANRIRLLHREIVQLIVLVLVAVGAFLLTRAIAANNRAMNLQHGVEWYEEGQRRLASGDVDRAIEAFRRATVRNRQERRYALALAGALASQGRNDVARAALLRLREVAPEDIGINLQLARLAAGRADVSEAVRYYHNTLYAPWPTPRAAERRDVRRELVRFLLDHGRTDAALSELVALETELPPDDAGAYAELGDLYAEAGDPGRALDAFERALALAPSHAQALAGAGRAALALDDFSLARRYLRAARDRGAMVDEPLGLAELVLSTDPLAARISAAARRARVESALADVGERLGVCRMDRAMRGQQSPEIVALEIQAEAFAARVPARGALDDDLLTEAVNLLARMAAAAGRYCPPAAPADQALVRIGRLHGADVP